jgi:hypothetical protein
MMRESLHPSADAGNARKRTLLPGKLMLVVGLVGTSIGWVGALSIAAQMGARGQALDSRLGAEILVAMGWVLYKLGSQRIVLDRDEMRIYTWGLCWRVPRGSVREVDLRLRELLSVVVVLADGYRIRPTTFATRSGIGQHNPNFMDRGGIRDAIMTWNGDAPPAPSRAQGARGRYWRVRTDDLPVLVAMAVLVLIVALAA